MAGCCSSSAKDASRSDSSGDPVGDMKAKANDRALAKLGVRSLNLGSLPIGAKLVNLPNQVFCLLRINNEKYCWDVVLCYCLLYLLSSWVLR